MQNSDNSQRISCIETNIKYSFSDKSLLLKALTHSSYSYDNKLDYNYERLEFLGDAVIELIITEYLVSKYSKFQEGDLSILRAYLVNEESLYDIAKRLDIPKNILLGKSELHGNGELKQAIVADIFEAIIAAIYLDNGFDTAKKIVLSIFADIIDDAVTNNAFKDPKTMVQQICQREFGKLPEYTVVDSTGPEHDKTFIVEIDMCGRIKAQGTGKTKKTAEKQAAAAALKEYKAKFNV